MPAEQGRRAEHGERRHPGLTLVVAATFFWLLYRAARIGPDFVHYWEWGEAALAGNVFRLGGATQTPMGLPASVWAHGAGMMLAAPKLVLGGRFGTNAPNVLVGWLAAMAFWWAMTRLLVLASGGRPAFVLFGTALVFLGTNAGHYSTVHATESLSLGLLATLALTVLEPAPRHARDALLAGLLGGLLVVTRTQLVPYVALALGVLCVRWHAQGLLRTPARFAALVAIALVPIGLASAQVAFVNRWMTGSFFRSFWSFGVPGFDSIDFGDPEWLAVLVHPWHGALAYHPLFALGFVALVAAVIRPPKMAPYPLLYLGVAAVVILQVALQAAWFCWWMGMGSFGMRSMAVSAVGLVPALIAKPAERTGADRGTQVWLLACGLAALWSYLLLVQGETNFPDRGALLAGQGAALRSAVLPLVAAAGVFALGSRRDRSLDGRLVAASAALWALALAHLFDSPRFGLPQSSPVLRAAGVGVLGVALLAIFRRLEFQARAGRVVMRTVATSAALLYGIVLLCFVRVGIDAERFIASGRPAPRPFQDVGTVPLAQIAASLREYAYVEGFEDKKRRLASYVAQAKRASRPAARRTPQSIHPRP